MGISGIFRVFEGVRSARVGHKWDKQQMGNRILRSWSRNKVIDWREKGMGWGWERGGS